MDIKSIRSQAPTRIDLAGGTVDIWPLYLFLEDPITLNLGIDLYAEATIDLDTSSKGQICLRSLDQNMERKLSWKELEEGTQASGSLELHYKLLKFFHFKRKEAGLDSSHLNLTLSTLAKSPAGAGLGGSSALSIAMIGALATWAAESPSPVNFDAHGEDFIEIVRDVETTVIQVPAGLQDYYGAMYGGLQSLQWGAGTHRRSPLSNDILPELEKRLLLFYSGQSRNSGINNWALFKNFIDRQEGIRSRFQEIVTATRKLQVALEHRNWNGVAQAITDEWNVRKTLSSGITTPEIDRAFGEAQKLAKAHHVNSSLAGKVCGAGGGGCFFVFMPDESLELRQAIQDTLIQNGMHLLDFHAVPRGLKVEVTHR